MSRGRTSNGLYITQREQINEQCAHVTLHGRLDPKADLAAVLFRSSAQLAAVDQNRHSAEGQMFEGAERGAAIGRTTSQHSDHLALGIGPAAGR